MATNAIVSLANPASRNLANLAFHSVAPKSNDGHRCGEETTRGDKVDPDIPTVQAENKQREKRNDVKRGCEPEIKNNLASAWRLEPPEEPHNAQANPLVSAASPKWRPWNLKGPLCPRSARVAPLVQTSNDKEGCRRPNAGADVVVHETLYNKSGISCPKPATSTESCMRGHSDDEHPWIAH